MRYHTVVSSEHGDRCIEEHGLVSKEAVACGVAGDALQKCNRCGKPIGYNRYFGHEWDYRTNSVRPFHFSCTNSNV